MPQSKKPKRPKKPKEVRDPRLPKPEKRPRKPKEPLVCWNCCTEAGIAKGLAGQITSAYRKLFLEGKTVTCEYCGTASSIFDG